MENKIEEIELNNYEVKIYDKIRKIKKDKLKKDLLKEFGDTPIFFMMLFNSLIATLCSILYLKYFEHLDLQLSLKFPEIEPYYTLMIVCLGIGIFTLFFMINILSILLYNKSVLLKGFEQQEK